MRLKIYNNVVPHWSAVLISCNYSVTRLISFTKKNASNNRSILSVYGPRFAPPLGFLFLNVYGAQELILRDQFRQPM
jgi:hypothetical protein